MIIQRSSICSCSDEDICARLREYALEHLDLKIITDIVVMARCLKYQTSHENVVEAPLREHALLSGVSASVIFVPGKCFTTSHELKDLIDEQYVKKEDYPNLFFHLSYGAKIVAVIRNKRPEDIENCGHAVLAKFSNLVRLNYFLTHHFTLIRNR